ncbi:hypothetical protein AQUCO_01000592v1 [Aquilegia coerulea]|uniref:non-specific serine/threonine protein kinase n=1 Tax=Aquilegia coerulea TaxID=218851 RepID=A0A2G5EAP1_AQUCA|nr:hypothetical protein AQUCO_01000592v1 [Aquilegia coerulea]
MMMDKGNDGESNSESVTRFLSELASEKPQPYSYVQLKDFTKDFSNILGSGGFGDVYKGQFPDGVPIAVKVLKNSRADIMEMQFKAEVGTMGRTYHRNLIKLYGYCYETNTKALIYDYMENGSLTTILFERKFDIPWLRLYTIAIEIAQGISYLHESCHPQIIHHDIKPGNVLLDSKHSPKVIDFGLARLNMEKSQFVQSRIRGSQGYVAPEMCLPTVAISCKCDVYSFGMMLFDILGSKRNCVGQRWFPGQVWQKVQDNQLDSFIINCGIEEENKVNTKTLSIVALMCAQHIPRDRPSMSTVVKILQLEIKPRTPVINPFPYYDVSSENSMYEEN